MDKLSPKRKREIIPGIITINEIAKYKYFFPIISIVFKTARFEVFLKQKNAKILSLYG